MSLTIFFYMLL